MQEFFGEYINIIGGISVLTATGMVIRILGYFKKAKYVIPFFNQAKSSAENIFGKQEVAEFLVEAGKILGIEII